MVDFISIIIVGTYYVFVVVRSRIRVFVQTEIVLITVAFFFVSILL